MDDNDLFSLLTSGQYDAAPSVPFNQQYSAAPGVPFDQQYSAAPGVPFNQQYSAPPTSNGSVPFNQQYSAAPGVPFNQQYSAPPTSNGSVPFNQQYSAAPGVPFNQQYSAPPTSNGSVPFNQQHSAPPTSNGSVPFNQQYSAAPGVPFNQQYNAPPTSGQFAAGPQQGQYSAGPQTAPQSGQFSAGPSGNYNIRQEIYNGLIARGVGPKAAAGFVGGQMGESGQNLNPNSYNPNDNGSPSGGFAQWHADRWDGLQNYANQQGTQWQDPKTQVDWYFNELDNSKRFKNVIPSLQANDSVANGLKISVNNYEVPANKSSEIVRRTPIANNFYNQVQNGSAFSTPTPSPQTQQYRMNNFTTAIPQSPMYGVGASGLMGGNQ